MEEIKQITEQIKDDYKVNTFGIYCTKLHVWKLKRAPEKITRVN